MVTLHAMRNVDGDKLYAYDFCGLSTDEKPQTYGGKELEANSMFLELDTGDFYFLETPASSSRSLYYENSEIEANVPQGNGYNFFEASAEGLDVEKITVVFDGRTYECDIKEYMGLYYYGASVQLVDNAPLFDFSDYPFNISTFESGGNKVLGITLQDENMHSIEIYVDSSTPAVWKKVGSGASPSPSGDGYEITNPVLTLNIIGGLPEAIEEAYYVDENGYLTLGSIDDASGETKLVMVDDGAGYLVAIPTPSSHSNEVNCTVDIGDNTMVITITDPTQDAYIDVDYTIG